MSRRTADEKLLRPSVSLAIVTTVAAAGGGAYLLHFNLSAIGSLYLSFVVLIALRWGFAQATVASVTAVLCMNYFFVPPIFQLQVADPENWISLATFETAALVVSGLSSKVLQHAAQADLQRERTSKLYELSRAILLIDSRSSTGEQLSPLIRELLHVDLVDLWVTPDGEQPSPAQSSDALHGSAFEAFQQGIDSDDSATRSTRRLLRVGTTPIGAMVLQGWEHDALLADAVASLAAVAFERARAIHKENRAEAERNTEQLRTAVLDGLAHGFKTPLTAIQTASSGLLAINQLNATQTELVSIIDEQATMLGHMTTRLLQTAALESRHIRLRRSRTSIPAFLQEVCGTQDAATRSRTRVSTPPDMIAIDIDPSMVELALQQLLDNAAKYSAVGEPIDLTTRQDERETTIIVENRGAFIHPEERERIFERFYRGLDATHGPAGTGLGLSIVKKTAEAHGGRAWVDSIDGKTRFSFTVENYRGDANG